ncbi:MAG: phage terminase large subunit [Proteobacteria bacterium]|nr:phage terminase large subunit [Pseudomonadota bacterium]MBU6425495.1 phage terminase large subunit [Rhodospirillales bacterium]
MSDVGQNPAPHHELLIRHLQSVADGACDRLMVQMPPGSAKSTYGSVLFPAWFMARGNGAQVIAAAHTASLAHYFGGRVRTTLARHGDWLGVEIAKTAKASSKFSLAGGEEYFSAGVRGPITGRRADLIVIDDPVKNWAEAESQAQRDMLFDWYRAELTARLKPGGRVVLIMTRWHEDDLAGRLLATEGGWRCLRLPALAEAGDELGRAPGEPLWPALQSAEELERRRREVGERAFAAMYQQAPKARESGLFRVGAVTRLAAAPDVKMSVRAWDLAATQAGGGRRPDYTVGLKLGMTEDDRLVVLDVRRLQGSPAQVEAAIKETARLDGLGTMISLPQDPGQAGAAQIAMLARGLIGFRVISSPERDAKMVRAMPAATQVDAGNFEIVAGGWNDAFLAEMREFPHGLHDDQIDALSRAVNSLATLVQAPARRLNVPLLSR